MRHSTTPGLWTMWHRYARTTPMSPLGADEYCASNNALVCLFYVANLVYQHVNNNATSSYNCTQREIIDIFGHDFPYATASVTLPLCFNEQRCGLQLSYDGLVHFAALFQLARVYEKDCPDPFHYIVLFGKYLFEDIISDDYVPFSSFTTKKKKDQKKNFGLQTIPMVTFLQKIKVLLTHMWYSRCLMGNGNDTLPNNPYLIYEETTTEPFRYYYEDTTFPVWPYKDDLQQNWQPSTPPSLEYAK